MTNALQDPHVELLRRLLNLRKSSFEFIKAYQTGNDSSAITTICDGEWSRHTLDAVRRHKAVALELNGPWCSVPAEWVCPCCRRTKAEIFRIDAGRKLIGKLCYHHDHFDDFFKDEARRGFGEDWGASPQLLSAENAFYSAFIGFDHVLICEDCNGAERKIKELLELDDPYCSLSIDIVRRGICKVIHQPDLVDKAKVKGRIQRSEIMEALDYRKRAVLEGITLLKCGVFWKTTELNKGRSEVDADLQDGLRKLGFDLDQSNFLLDLDVLSRTDLSKPRSWWRERVPDYPHVPTKSQVEEFMAAARARENLAAYTDDWKCPCCGRTFAEMVRLSNRKKTTANIRRFGVYPDQITICDDCNDIACKIGRELDCDKNELNLADVRKFFDPRRNAGHLVRRREAAGLIDTLREARRREPEKDEFISIY